MGMVRGSTIEEKHSPTARGLGMGMGGSSSSVKTMSDKGMTKSDKGMTKTNPTPTPTDSPTTAMPTGSPTRTPVCFLTTLTITGCVSEQEVPFDTVKVFWNGKGQMNNYEVKDGFTALYDLSITLLLGDDEVYVDNIISGGTVQKIVLPGDVKGSLERKLSGYRAFYYTAPNEILSNIETFNQKAKGEFTQQFDGTIFRIAGSKASGLDQIEVIAITNDGPSRKLCNINEPMTEDLTCSNEDLA
jgi:hypothetical protein